jgi:peroxiredoxin
MLPVSSVAPDFTLFSTIGKEVSLYDFRGKRVLLVFYPADWSPVCGDQLALYNEMEQLFESYNTEVLAISVDSRWCHTSYQEQRNINFQLLSDFEPKGAVSRLYEAYHQDEGTSQRALYLLDENSVIAWNQLASLDQNPGADGIIMALENMGSLFTAPPKKI